MAELRLDGEDILRSAAAPSPRGMHGVDGQTDLYLGRSHTSPASLMVSRHEAVHFRLMSYSSFGLLVKAVYDDIVRRQIEPERLLGLVDMMRRTQEIAATAVGLWMTIGDPDELLAPYPAYRAYLEDARHLARGLVQGSYGSMLLVEQACRAALQIPLLHLRPDPATWGSLGPEDLSDHLWPDNRLQVLLGADLALGEVVEAERGAMPASVPMRENDFVRWYHGQSEWVFNYAAAVLKRSGGHATASFNGQILEGKMLGNPEERIRHFREGRAMARVHVSEDRMPLAVREATQEEIADAHPGNCLLVVRPLVRLLDQYVFSEAGEARLRAAACSNAVIGLRQLEIVEGQPLGRLLVFNSPQELGRIAVASKAFLGSVSTSVLFSDWSQKWLPDLAETGCWLSFLIDSDVDDFTEQMKMALLTEAAARPRVEAGHLTLEFQEGESVALAYMRIMRSTDEIQHPLSVAICDPDSAIGLARNWSEQLGGAPGNDEPTRNLLGQLIGLLVYGEPWFDFNASLNSNPG